MVSNVMRLVYNCVYNIDKRNECYILAFFGGALAVSYRVKFKLWLKFDDGIKFKHILIYTYNLTYPFTCKKKNAMVCVNFSNLESNLSVNMQLKSMNLDLPSSNINKKEKILIRLSFLPLS